MALIAQLVEHCTGNAEVVGSNPVQSLDFFSGHFSSRVVAAFASFILSLRRVFEDKFWTTQKKKDDKWHRCFLFPLLVLAYDIWYEKRQYSQANYCNALHFKIHTPFVIKLPQPHYNHLNVKSGSSIFSNSC